MTDQGMSKNQRENQRFAVSFPIQLKFGSQITLQGEVKDISAKSAFVKIKGSVHMQTHDELEFEIKRSLDAVKGWARISRVAAGEGIVIYFTKMDEGSARRLKEWVTI